MSGFWRSGGEVPFGAHSMKMELQNSKLSCAESRLGHKIYNGSLHLLPFGLWAHSQRNGHDVLCYHRSAEEWPSGF